MIQDEKNTVNKEKPLFLVSPLDWGLGHSFRIIPVIRYLQERGCDIIVACNSIQKLLLEPELPGVRFVFLRGYNIRYGRSRTATLAALLRQLPNILIRVKYEQMWFLRFFGQNQVQAVLSDNRYGLYSTRVPSVLITHQLQIETGFGQWIDRTVQKLLYDRITKFSECWVPDYVERPGLAGDLSHPKNLPAVPVRYMGAVSRLTASETASKAVRILFLLSGPEPQRTLFEKIIVGQLQKKSFPEVVLVRGIVSGGSSVPPPAGGATVIPYAAAQQLSMLFSSAELIICRPGFTTVMDAMPFKKKLVVVPTPGQAEQEYLARHLSENGMAASIAQHEFDIDRAIELAASFTYRAPAFPTDQYKKVIDAFIASRFSL